jgi:L-ascorbate metabolism protein UlaG (beta-lactamase superfamily)
VGRVLVALMYLLAGAVVHAGPVREPVTFTYQGNAGWQIEAAHKIILVDPYLSEFGPEPDSNETDPLVKPDQAQIDAHIHKADYILITHGHIDHMLDAPYISNKTGAVIICTQSHANIARAYGVPEERLMNQIIGLRPDIAVIASCARWAIRL